MAKFFPDPRRIITGHSSSGKAIVLSDSTVPCEPTPLGSNFGRIWEAGEFPASNDGPGELEEKGQMELVNENGVVMRCVDIQPHCPAFMHRTVSLDFGILMEGEVTWCFVLGVSREDWLSASSELDDGTTVDMKPGDICVQRGTIHGWINKSDKAARMYFVFVSAKKVVIDGQELGEELGGGGASQASLLNS